MDGISLPLAGKTILVTRPREQSRELGAAIAALGGTPYFFPLLEIGPAPDSRALIEAARRLDEYALAVFISPNAVAYALPELLARGSWPAHLRPVAVGPGTARALAEGGILDCLTPRERFDSEALLALPELATEQVRGLRIALFRGNGGRELLADTLRTRGGRVDCIPCYQRSAPQTGARELWRLLAVGQVDGLLITSSEALGNLLALPGAGACVALKSLPLFAPHARIADKALALDFSRVVLTGPADAGLLAGLCAYNWSQP